MKGVVLSDAKPTGYNDPLTEDEVETIVSLKRDEGLSVQEIAEQTGRSVPTINRYLSRNGISNRTPRVKTPPLTQKQWHSIRVAKEHDMLSADIAVLMAADLGEVNRAYGSPTYEYYINHR